MPKLVRGDLTKLSRRNPLLKFRILSGSNIHIPFLIIAAVTRKSRAMAFSWAPRPDPDRLGRTDARTRHTAMVQRGVRAEDVPGELRLPRRAEERREGNQAAELVEDRTG